MRIKGNESNSHPNYSNAIPTSEDCITQVTSAGFKPTTFGTGIRRSIQLNYEANQN